MNPQRSGSAGPHDWSQYRLAQLLRPVGRSRWPMAAVLGVGLGAIMVLPALTGYPHVASAIGLGFVLTATPILPLSPGPAAVTIGMRASCVIAAAVLVVSAAGHPFAVAALAVAAAVTGALIASVGPTAALAVVLVAVDNGAFRGGAAQWTQVPLYVIGAAAVPVAWSVWWLGRLACRAADRSEEAAQARAPADAGNPRGRHAMRVGTAVAIAVTLAALMPADLVGVHWLVTCVVLTIQPGPDQTGVRLVQRLSGNTVGAVIAAGLLGTGLPSTAMVGLTVALFITAMALRPVNYTWWAVTGPPVLLVLSEYPQTFPWYEGGVRLAMNLLGATVVAFVVFLVPAVWGRAMRGRGDRKPIVDIGSNLERRA